MLDLCRTSCVSVESSVQPSLVRITPAAVASPPRSSATVSRRPPPPPGPASSVLPRGSRTAGICSRCAVPGSRFRTGRSWASSAVASSPSSWSCRPSAELAARLPLRRLLRRRRAQARTRREPPLMLWRSPCYLLHVVSFYLFPR